ncbi:C2 calcium-dependent domain-containing protein 4C-like [Megalops cyprinoides]|uniref:C2 calcium-dependent domain-containing protein 4C-like n=1 Tax=Megalops cyprinoides TaxID=118141 RepID=UPI001865207D|nr:C2 calcium-dependent domain-containing protein 4C-like [Megalops cyprinoides]
MWVVDKIRVSVERTNLPLPVAEYSFKIADIMFGDKITSGKSKKVALCRNIITPDTIPEFCIPMRIPALQEPSKPIPVSAVGTSHSDRGTPGKEAPVRELVSTHIIQVESVDDAPYENGYSDEESTNADPQSQAALSLPHLAKTQTCYGFCTLLESPHTRRKESIFHNDPSSCGIPLVVPRSRSNTCSKPSPSSNSLPSSPSSVSFGFQMLNSRLSPRGLSLSRQGTLDSDTTSSAESSPFSSPMLTRPPPKSSLFKALSHDKLLSRGARRITVSRNNSLSTDEGSSTDNSPNVLRRASKDLLEPLPSSFRLAPPAIFPMDLVLYRDCVLKESRVPLGKDGALRLSAEYCPENQRLRVRLISAEGLYAPSTDPKSINCNVSISMMPGKAQKQRSTVIRKSRNPIFNEDFFFDGVSEDDLCARSLRFKVVNKMPTMKRDYVLGDCEIPLTSILVV